MLLKIDQISHLPQWATVVWEEQSVAGAEENLMQMFLQNPHNSVNLYHLGSYSTVALLEYLQVPQNSSLLLTSA